MLGNAEVMDAEAKWFELGFGDMPKYQKGYRGFERIARVSNTFISYTLVYNVN